MAGHGGAWTLSGVGIRGCARGSNHCGNLVVQGPSDGTPAWMAHAPLVSAAELDGAGPSDTIGLVASTRIGQNRRRGPGERGRERLWGGGELVASPGGSQWGVWGGSMAPLGIAERRNRGGRLCRDGLPWPLTCRAGDRTLPPIETDRSVSLAALRPNVRTA